MRHGKTWNWRKPDESHVIRFENDGSTFSALYKAQRWLTENGYKYGSSCAMCNYTAAVKGDDYPLPQKVHNFDKEDYLATDAVIYTFDAREGWVEVWILK